MFSGCKEENTAVAGYGEAFWRGSTETDKQDGREILRQTRKSVAQTVTMDEHFSESSILAQDERWRRA